MTTKTLKLGSKARDTVSGWEGTLTARYEYMNGCVRYEVSASDKDGKPEAFVFDQQQIEMIEEKAPPAEPKPTGGPRGNRPPARR
jgi:hypothetical protein